MIKQMTKLLFEKRADVEMPQDRIWNLSNIVLKLQLRKEGDFKENSVFSGLKIS